MITPWYIIVKCIHEIKFVMRLKSLEKYLLKYSFLSNNEIYIGNQFIGEPYTKPLVASLLLVLVHMCRHHFGSSAILYSSQA